MSDCNSKLGTRGRKCYGKKPVIKDGETVWEEYIGYFHGFFTESDDDGMYTIALIETDDGNIYCVPLHYYFRFIEGGNKECLIL